MNEIIAVANTPLALIAVLINSVFIILVLVRSSRTNVYKTFLFICIVVMYWNLSEFMRLTSGRPYWFYLSQMGSSFIPALMFHFIMTLVRPNQKNTSWIAPAYFLSCLLALASFVSSFHRGDLSPSVDIYWDIAYFISFGPFFLSGLYLLICAIRAARSEDERSQLQYILIADIIGLIAVTTDHGQTMKIPAPPLGHLGSVLYSSILAFGIFKHRTSYDILAQMRIKLEALSNMAAGIAHEIRNPLTSIKGAAELIGDELKDFDHPKCQEYIDIITEEVERLNNILTNFQYYTKPIKIRTEQVSVTEVIRKTAKLAEMGAWHIHIMQESAGNLPMVHVDTSLMKQVFLNLIKNAAEACGPRAELIVRTGYTHPWVNIDFTDNGPGIPQELLGHIFDPFFTTKTTGMGVGLAITKRVVEAHHGRIEASNISPNGARFSIFLPAEEDIT